jgi:DNA modification methylase
MEVTSWPLEKIVPYARNARQIPTRAIDKVAASIQEFGWRQPIVVDKDGVIIVGHVRLLAAHKLGLKEAPVHVAHNLTAAQVRAYRLLDNRSHEETAWDDDLLGLELLDLQAMGLDLDLTGFEMEEIDDLLARAEISSGLTDPDAVPEIPEHPVSTLGDLWVLGHHRLLCGDATTLNDVERVLANGLAGMVFTDPPYNVNYSQPSATRERAGRKIANDNLGLAFEPFLSQACRNLMKMTQGAIYISMSSSEIDTLKRAFVEAGGHWSTFLIWAKNTFTLGRSDYQRQYEPILYGWREGGSHYWCGARDQGDLWLMNKPVANDLHPTQKPVELIERAISNSSKPSDIVLDPFAGSGSTLISCEHTGRQARLIEIDPKYVDTAVMRWQEFTGRTAILDGDGQTFAEIGQHRNRAPSAEMPTTMNSVAKAPVAGNS